MNKTINKFALISDKLMLKLYLTSQDLRIMLVDHLINTVKEFKNLEKQVI